MRSLALKLSPGSDLRLSIEKLGRDQHSSGFVLGVVGNLSQASFQCPGRKDPTVLEGNLEIITLNGTFSPNGVHLHLSLSDGDCQVWGGHLEPGTLVLKGADVLVGLVEEQPHINSQLTAPVPQQVLPRVEIAVMPKCPWSARALRLLQNLEIPHTVNSVDNDESFYTFRERTNLDTFPQVFVDGDLIGGYESLAELHKSGKLIELR